MGSGAGRLARGRSVWLVGGGEALAAELVEPVVPDPWRAEAAGREPVARRARRGEASVVAWRPEVGDVVVGAAAWGAVGAAELVVGACGAAAAGWVAGVPFFGPFPLPFDWPWAEIPRAVTCGAATPGAFFAWPGGRSGFAAWAAVAPSVREQMARVTYARITYVVEQTPAGVKRNRSA